MKKRRGVSEIIASLVVLIIVSVLGLMLFTTSQNALSGQTENMISTSLFETEKAQERFEVVSVEYIEDDAIKLNLLNYGPSKTLNVTINAVYLNSTQVNETPSRVKLEQNIVTQITVTLTDGTLESEKNYVILVVSARGVSYAYTWKAPHI